MAVGSVIAKLRPKAGRFLRNKYFQKLRFLGTRAGYRFWRLLPVKPGRIVLASDSRESLSGNLKYLADDIAARYSDHELVPVLRPHLSARRTLKDALRLPFLLATAEVIILDDYYPLIYAMTIRPETQVAQAWHAAGAFKRVGFSRQGLPGGPIPGSNVHSGYTFLSVSAEGVRESYSEAFNMPIEKVHALGVPRSDLFFDARLIAETRARIRGELNIPEGNRVVLYAPTFRGRGQKSAYFDLGQFPWSELGSLEFGALNVTVLLKQHPFVPALQPGQAEALGLVDVSEYREVNELLLVADVLVTDYSSVIFEYALLKRPMIFFTPDLEEYTELRDFYHPFDTYLVGPVVRDADALGDAVQRALSDGIEDQAKYDAFVEQFCGACDGHSTSRVVDALMTRSLHQLPTGVEK